MSKLPAPTHQWVMRKDWLLRAAVEFYGGRLEANRIFGPRGPGRWNPNSRTACDCGRKAKP